MNWNEFAKEVHQVVVDHGFWEKPPSFTAQVVMFHSELSEAVEELRLGRPMFYYPCNAGGLCDDDLPQKERTVCGTRIIDPENPEGPCKAMSKKPCGVAVELADCILRILDTLADAGMDIDAEIGFGLVFTDTIQTIAKCHHHISAAYVEATGVNKDIKRAHICLLMCVETIMAWADENDVDMEAILRDKHEYNKTRPYRHGGKLM